MGKNVGRAQPRCLEEMITRHVFILIFNPVMRPILFLLALFALAGCGTPQRDEFGHKLRQIEIGMLKNQVIAVFDEAVPRGAKKYPNGTIEVLEVRNEYYAPFAARADPWTGYVTEKPTWFYFYNGKLVQYGAPNDWPADPDRIIEIRQR
jgi:hypothetical protein